CDAIPDGATAVVVDDICDGGGTFIGLANAIGHPKHRMRLWTSHGIYSKPLEPLLERFERIASTDSFPSLHRASDRIHTQTSALALLVNHLDQTVLDQTAPDNAN
ncbi:MAG TPA: hypothetical protein VMM60_13885, partial [Ilumatobacter sp.]|nr:hypothetical protein [Ilumatobacter sp.]